MVEVAAMPRIFEELPAPPRPVLTEEQKYRRRRRFAVVLNWFVLGYSLVHKLFLPLYVSLARSASFAILDWWWVYHVALALLLLRRNWDDALLRLAAYFGIGGAICQLVVSFRERNWHSVSLWVTSASTLWVVFYLLALMRSRLAAGRPAGKLALQTLAVALGFLVQFALFGFTFTVEKVAKSAKISASKPADWPVLADANACGAMGFSIPLANGVPAVPPLSRLQAVDVKACGFSAAMASFDPSKTLDVRNETGGYLNVKAYIPWEGRWRPLQNMPLPPGLVHHLGADVLAGHPVILLASDADPKKGLLLLVSDPSSLVDAFAGGSKLLIDRTGLFPQKVSGTSPGKNATP